MPQISRVSRHRRPAQHCHRRLFMTVTVASPLRDGLFRDSYIVVPDVLGPINVIQPMLEECAGVVDGFATDPAASGQISSVYADLPFEARLIQIAKECGSTAGRHRAAATDLLAALTELTSRTWHLPADFAVGEAL